MTTQYERVFRSEFSVSFRIFISIIFHNRGARHGTYGGNFRLSLCRLMRLAIFAKVARRSRSENEDARLMARIYVIRRSSYLRESPNSHSRLTYVRTGLIKLPSRSLLSRL